MHLLFLAQCYAPEEVSAAFLITELAEDLAKRGHTVTMVTGAPNYPQGRVFHGYRNKIYQTEWLNGVRVIRTWSFISPSKGFLQRIFHYGTYSGTALFGGIMGGRPDILVSYSPPLPLGLSAWLLSRIWKIPWVLQLEDLYPEAAVAAGVLRNRRVISFFSLMERFIYRKATHISLISERFRENLISKKVEPNKMTLIPVWADPDVVRLLPKENDFRDRHGLSRRFVVMYAGNIGHTSSLEDVLSAAELLKSESDIFFAILGEGVKKPILREAAQAKGLENVFFLPYQPREVFAEMMAAADVSLVTLNQASSLSSLPSKTFNIMASARPILAVTPPESEIARLVTEGQCGINVPPNQPALLADQVLRLKSQPGRLEEMGYNGRHHMETKFSRRRCVEMYDTMLKELAGKNGQGNNRGIPP
jgi:colanic acid biosynthesis glycosyl transferase WcaI